MELLYGTANQGKLLVMRRALSPLGIRVKGLMDRKEKIPIVPETGHSLLENARLKAKAYFEVYKTPVFSCDTGLYFENVPQEYQPGIYVRRVKGYEMSDEEMTEYYAGLAQKFGDLRAQYRNAVCYCKSEQEVYESDGVQFWGNLFCLLPFPIEEASLVFP